MTARFALSIVIAALAVSFPAGAHAGAQGAPPALRGTADTAPSAQRIYAATTVCNVTGRARCGRGIFRLPEGTTPDLCEAAGMELRGHVIVGPDGHTGEVLQWTCFESATPVKGAIDEYPEAAKTTDR